MLYKKYHRNYVSRFKKGVEFVCRNSCSNNSDRYSRYTVEKEPYYTYKGIRITGNTYYLILVFLDGSINSNIKVENAV